MIGSVLVTNPTLRLTAKEMLKDNWLKVGY
jgi:hypothetical protein